MIRACAVVPYFEHPHTLEGCVDALRRNGLKCWIVDDGSGPAAQAVAQRIAARDSGVTVLPHTVNRGKGAAVLTGCRAASRRRFHSRLAGRCRRAA